MEHCVLGASGLLVSPICLGTMTFGEPVAEREAIQLVHAAGDLGINFIDTANVYEGYRRFLGSPGGVAEQIVGKALPGRRDQFVVATKVGAPVGPGPQDRGLSATHILRELDRSLQRLQTDYIDLYILHWPDQHVPLAATLGALDQAVRQGKIRYVGASNHDAGLLCEMLWLADRNGWARPVSSQIPFSLLRREFQNELPFCARHQIAVTPYQSLQGGLLTGKYSLGGAPPSDSRAAEKPEWMWELSEDRLKQLQQLDALAAQLGVPTSQYALAWTLMQPAMCSLVVGAKTVAQIQDAVAALSVEIPAEHLTEIDNIYPPPWRQMDPIRG